MEDKFKSYLESAFRTIAPTKAAMEYRKQTLKDMLARAQELRIKGMTDEDLIFDTVLEDYEDFGDKLKEFEQKEIKTNSAKRNVLLGTVIGVAVTVILVVAYLLVGLLGHLWHPGWLIIVGGLFLGVGVLLGLAGIKAIAKKRFVALRLFVVIAEVLLSVFVFLLLQIVFKFNGSWMAFLAMVALILGVDTAIAFFTNSKGKWIELPIFVEGLSVMLYVILGLVISFWHPGWLLCLVGVVFAVCELVVFVALHNNKKEKKEKKKLSDKFVKTDEKYWSDWD